MKIVIGKVDPVSLEQINAEQAEIYDYRPVAVGSLAFTPLKSGRFALRFSFPIDGECLPASITVDRAAAKAFADGILLKLQAN